MISDDKSFSEGYKEYLEKQANRPLIVRILDKVHSVLFYRLPENLNFIFSKKYKLEKEHKQIGLTYWDRPKKVYDKFALDSTLAWVIYPMIVRFKRAKRWGCVDELFDNSTKGDECAKWEDVLDKIIYTFESLLIDESTFDIELETIKYEEIQEGLDLFSKYFRNLWD
jgi:hypothetical protein